MTVKPERHSGLGRGLTSLIPQRSQQISATEISLARIRPNPRQPATSRAVPSVDRAMNSPA